VRRVGLAAVVLAAALHAAPAESASPSRLDVPVIRQRPERCGPAAVEMVLRFYGAAPESLAGLERAYDPVLRGSLVTALAAEARRAGYPAEIESPGEDSLAALLAAGVPPVLLYDRGVGPVTRRHYGVVVGWDPDRRVYMLNDGGSWPRTIGRDDLMRRWAAAGGQALVVRRRSP
jgi:hypothetical protein